MGAQRRTARRDVACNVSDVAMLRLYQISLPSLIVLTNNPRLYSAVSATSAVRARFDSGILGHVLGHLLVDSKGLVPQSRNSHIVLCPSAPSVVQKGCCCWCWFFAGSSQLEASSCFPERNPAVHKTFAESVFGFCSQRLVTNRGICPIFLNG